jgi:ABC-type taurine transport system ATPase subunit
VREEILLQLSGLEPQDMSAVKQISGSLRQLVGVPDQLTAKAQVLPCNITDEVTYTSTDS